MRPIARACIIFILCIAGTVGAKAADPKVAAALKEFSAVADDPAKLATWCAMSKAISANDGATQTPADEEAINRKMDAWLATLGPEFRESWMLLGALEPESEDGEAYSREIARLEGLCTRCWAKVAWDGAQRNPGPHILALRIALRFTEATFA